MLLVVFLGLIANLVLVLGDCNIGPPTLDDFDWSRFAGYGHWYALKHTSHGTEYNFDCIRDTIAAPEGNRSLFSTDVYDKNEHVHRTIHGYFTNWNSTGYFEFSTSSPLWNGVGHVIAVDYERYYIGKYCNVRRNKLTVYAAYRSPHPDQETVNEVNREMQTRNLDTSQMVDLPADHCPSEESSAAAGSSA